MVSSEHRDDRCEIHDYWPYLPYKQPYCAINSALAIRSVFLEVRIISGTENITLQPDLVVCIMYIPPASMNMKFSF